jgi:hypothetical protein
MLKLHLEVFLVRIIGLEPTLNSIRFGNFKQLQ